MLRTALQRATCAASSAAAACTPSGSLEALASRMAPAARSCWAPHQQRHFSSDDSEEKREINDPLVLELADRITQLNLLQVSDLTEILKQRLGIQDSPMMGMPMMGMPMGGPAAAAPGGDQAAAAAPAEEKTEFTLKLDGFDAAAKIKVIKEIRAITGLGLKEAKELVSGGFRFASYLTLRLFPSPGACCCRARLQATHLDVSLIYVLTIACVADGCLPCSCRLPCAAAHCCAPHCALGSHCSLPSTSHCCRWRARRKS